MKASSGIILSACAALALSACSTAGDYRSSFSYNGMTTPTMNLRDWHAYEDDGEELAPVLSKRSYHRYDGVQGLGPICNPYCRF